MMTKKVENLAGIVAWSSLESGGAEGKSGETPDYFYQSALNPSSWGSSGQILESPAQNPLRATSSRVSWV